MSHKERHVVPDPKGGWKIDKPHAERASAHSDIKAKAIDRAKEICWKEGAECVIRGKRCQTSVYEHFFWKLLLKSALIIDIYSHCNLKVVKSHVRMAQT